MAIGMVNELRAAMVDVLKANSELQALIGNPVRLYSQVKPNPTKPYVTLIGSQQVDDSVEKLDAAEIFINVDVWSDSPAKDDVECNTICSAIRRALHNADLTLTENRCVQIQERITRVFVDADNITRHGVVTFRAETEENLS